MSWKQKRKRQQTRRRPSEKSTWCWHASSLCPVLTCCSISYVGQCEIEDNKMFGSQLAKMLSMHIIMGGGGHLKRANDCMFRKYIQLFINNASFFCLIQHLMSVAEYFTALPVIQAGNENVTRLIQPQPGKEPLLWQPLFFFLQPCHKEQGKERVILKRVAKTKKKDLGYVKGKKNNKKRQVNK